MIYQIKAYYGAVKDSKVVFWVDFEVFDAKSTTHVFTMDENEIQKFMSEKMKEQGYDPSEFEFRWLTQKEYDGRPKSVVEKHTVEA